MKRPLRPAISIVFVAAFAAIMSGVAADSTSAEIERRAVVRRATDAVVWSMPPPGWNDIVRMYRPQKPLLDGTWNFPDATPVP